MQWVEARNAAKNPVMHGTVLETKDFLAQNQQLRLKNSELDKGICIKSGNIQKKKNNININVLSEAIIPI